MDKKCKVVVIGGGHGQSTILRGIKNIEEFDISAIVTVADDGGSTGRLRRKFHIPAMGDIRNVLISLAECESLFSSLMDYRFEDPEDSQEDVMGHNLGNLILTALTDQCGSFLEAVQVVGEVLNVKGHIIPATGQVIQLFARMDDGVMVRGEANIPNRYHHIEEVFYQEHVEATPEAIDAILEADLVIYGIGSIYTSILPNVIIPGIQEALKKTHAKRIYFCNAMSQPGETDGYSMEDHVRALQKHGAIVDGVLIPSESVPEAIEQRYNEHGSIVVRVLEQEHPYEIYQSPLLVFDGGVVRHDPIKIERAVQTIVSNRK